MNLYFLDEAVKINIRGRGVMDSWVMIYKKRAVVFLLTLTVLLFSSSFVYAQWESVNPPSVSSNWYLLGVHFTSPTEGWAVGEDTQTKEGHCFTIHGARGPR